MMQIYVVANGKLDGGWIKLPCDDLQERIDAILGKDEEYAIQGYVAPFKIKNLDNPHKLNEIAERLDALDEEEEVIEAILDNFHDVEEGLDILEGKDYRIYYNCDDMEDVAAQYAEETGLLNNIPEHLVPYFDFEAYGDDMSIQGTFLKAGKHYVQIIK